MTYANSSTLDRTIIPFLPSTRSVKEIRILPIETAFPSGVADVPHGLDLRKKLSAVPSRDRRLVDPSNFGKFFLRGPEHARSDMLHSAHKMTNMRKRI